MKMRKRDIRKIIEVLGIYGREYGYQFGLPLTGCKGEIDQMIFLVQQELKNIEPKKKKRAHKKNTFLVGDKVYPISKTCPDWGMDLKNSVHWGIAKDEKGYLTISSINNQMGRKVYSCTSQSDNNCGDYFLKEDLRHYEGDE